MPLRSHLQLAPDNYRRHPRTHMRSSPRQTRTTQRFTLDWTAELPSIYHQPGLKQRSESGPTLPEPHLDIGPVLQMRRLNKADPRWRGGHYYGFRVRAIARETDAAEQVAVGHAASREHQVAAGR